MMSGDSGSSLAEQKLKSFSIGTMGKRTLSKKEQEDLRKRQEEEDVGKVYKEFVSTFEDNPSSKVSSKTWVKAGTFNAGNRKEDTSGKGQLYKPTARIGGGLAAADDRDVKPSAHLNDTKLKRPEKPGKKKLQDKKKSNLEIFKEELKAMQEEREERHRFKSMGRSSGGGFGGGLAGLGGSPAGGPGGVMRASAESASTLYNDKEVGSHDNGDPNTTNLYLGNLSPRLTEQQMMELFGRFGPLASIKIMWPRTEDEKSRGRNCGFVAYMSRRDGERALANLCGKNIDGFEMKMGWGKPVPIPLHPIYVPPALLKFTLPPPPSGLPFNCQPSKEDMERWNVGHGPIPPPPGVSDRAKYDRLLRKSVVKVVIPTDRTTLCLINRMVEFVIREGPMFEAMIMNREMANRNFAFLFENQSPEHVYYRWRIFSILQGDSKDKWNTKEFRMFKGGSLWRPPLMNLYTSGMPDELVVDEDQADQTDDRKRSDDLSEEKDKSKSVKKGLSDSQRDRFEDMLRNLYPDRNPIAEAMVWCLEHADAGPEIVECIAEALSILETPLAKKIARLYLISDILHNCSVKGVPNVSFYRKGFQAILPDIFTDLRSCHQSIESRMRAEGFKQRVMNCFRAWEDWALYPQDFLIKLQNIFLGLFLERDNEVDSNQKTNDDDDVDGKSLSEDEDVDGTPLDGAALLKRGISGGVIPRHSDNDSDVDGTPIRHDENNKANNSNRSNNSNVLPAGFVPSKWETVDPEEVQAQAVTSKWELFDQRQQEEVSRKRKGVTDPDDDEDDIDGVPMQDADNYLDVRLSEDRRARLREVELKVMCYQDELESGKEGVRPGWTISEQVDQFRKKLLKSASAQRIETPTSATPDTPDFSSSRTPRGGGGTHGTTSNRSVKDSDEDSEDDRSRRGRNKKKAKRSRRSSSNSSRSRSRERKGSSRRRRRSSSSDDRGSRSKKSRRSRSRSPTTTSSSKKHKKKRH